MPLPIDCPCTEACEAFLDPDFRLPEGFLAQLRQPDTSNAPERKRPGKRFSSRFWLGAFLLLGLFGLSLLLMAQAVDPERELRDEQVLDFRGRDVPAVMTPFGPNVDQAIKPEAEGLRFTLPRERESSAPVGLSLSMQVEKDFEITTAFELLNADIPAPKAPSYGVGVLMSLNQAARIGCLLRANGEQVATWDRWATIDDSPKFLSGASPCTVKSGRIRLKRTGRILYFLWSPELVGDLFNEFYQFDFGTDDITLLRLELSGDLGGKPGALDVRLIDLRIRSSTAAADQIFVSADEHSGLSKVWFVLAGILGGIIALCVVVGLIVRRRRTALDAEKDFIAS